MITSAALSAQKEFLEKNLPGHQRESHGSNPPPRRTGEISVGHSVSDTTPSGDRFDPGRVDTHMWNQPPQLKPRDFPVLRPITPQGEEYAPVGSSMTDQLDRHSVTLQQFDAAGAASERPLPGHPTGDPTQVAHPGHDYHTAPTGFGLRPGLTPQRPAGNPYLPMPGEGNR